MTSTPRNTSDRDQQLLSVGQQCSEPTCLLIDFLPIKCQHCEQAFCSDHFRVAAHKCTKYDDRKYNRVAPNCPLCNTPVAVRIDQDPNIRMEDHFAQECSVMTGKSGRARSTPVCARAKCGKVLFAPIQCDKCKQQFCIQHRFPTDHTCATPKSNPSINSPKRLDTISTKATAASVATMGAIRKTIESATTSSSSSKSLPISKPAATSKPSTASTHHNPFSKTDRPSISTVSLQTTDNVSTYSPAKSTPEPAIDPIRAKAEQESRRRGMLERAKKGLLSEEEKQILAKEEAERAQHQDEKKGDCVVM